MSVRDSVKGLYILMLLGLPIAFIIIKMHVNLLHLPSYLVVFTALCYFSVYLSAIIARKIFRKRLGL